MTADAADWRDDPAWRLESWDRDYWGERPPPERPTKAAELAQPDSWASLYAGRRIVATWSRGLR